MELVNTKAHFIPPYFAEPKHPITISIIGVGGTGSLLLNRLVKLHLALIELNHPGIFVTAYDGDTFERHNVLKQRCDTFDVGRNKAVALIEKINLNFGFGWKAIPKFVDQTNNFENFETTNITITCVDKADFRMSFNSFVKSYRKRTFIDFSTPFYWLDCGNGKDFGQIILATFNEVKQPKNGTFQTCETLNTIVDLYGDVRKYDTEEIQQTQGCSIAESLSQQDLFVNDVAAVNAAQIIKKIFFNPYLTNHGIIFNEEQTLPIKL